MKRDIGLLDFSLANRQLAIRDLDVPNTGVLARESPLVCKRISLGALAIEIAAHFSEHIIRGLLVSISIPRLDWRLGYR